MCSIANSLTLISRKFTWLFTKNDGGPFRSVWRLVSAHEREDTRVAPDTLCISNADVVTRERNKGKYIRYIFRTHRHDLCHGDAFEKYNYVQLCAHGLLWNARQRGTVRACIIKLDWTLQWIRPKINRQCDKIIFGRAITSCWTVQWNRTATKISSHNVGK